MNIENINWGCIIIALIILFVFFICLFSIFKNYLFVGQENFKQFNNRNCIPEDEIENENIYPIYEIILYYTNWCSFSKTFLSEWDKFENYAKDNFKNLKIIKICCEGDNINLCDKSNIQGYPTVLFYDINNKNNKIIYDGKRTSDALIQFVKMQIN